MNNSVATNPISASPAPTRKATWKPSTSALGTNARLFPWSPRYESYRVNVIVDSTATPSAPPTCCEVLIRPEAIPASSWVTPISEAIWTGTNEKPSPTPAAPPPGGEVSRGGGAAPAGAGTPQSREVGGQAKKDTPPPPRARRTRGEGWVAAAPPPAPGNTQKSPATSSTMPVISTDRT